MFLKYNLALWKMALKKSPITSEIGYNSDPIFCRYHEGAATVAVTKPPKMLLKGMISPERENQKDGDHPGTHDSLIITFFWLW
jgi:hypothetical protein